MEAIKPIMTARRMQTSEIVDVTHIVAVVAVVAVIAATPIAAIIAIIPTTTVVVSATIYRRSCCNTRTALVAAAFEVAGSAA